MRRRWPCGSGTHAVAVVAGATAALTPGTGALKVPPGWLRPAASVAPPTTTWLLVNMRAPDWLNCTLARSTAGQASPVPMVSPTIFSVAEAPDGGGVITPFGLR